MDKYHSFWRRSAAICVVGAMVFLLSACSNRLPTESDAREVFESEHEKNIDLGLVQVESFSIVNSQKGDYFGLKYYTVEYRATISWPKGLNTHCLGDRAKAINCMMARTREIGQLEELTGTLQFGETEKGWKAENGKIY